MRPSRTGLVSTALIMTREETPARARREHEVVCQKDVPYLWPGTSQNDAIHSKPGTPAGDPATRVHGTSHHRRVWHPRNIPGPVPWLGSVGPMVPSPKAMQREPASMTDSYFRSRRQPTW